jgi:hypothetical protein
MDGPGWELTATRPIRWEQLLYGATLLNGIEEHECEFATTRSIYPPPSSVYVSDVAEVASFMQRKY